MISLMKLVFSVHDLSIYTLLQTVVVTQNQVSCRQAEYFTNPNKFVPERWMKGHPLYKQVSPYLVLPFGHGPRTCIARWLAEQNMHALILKVSKLFHWLKWMFSKLLYLQKNCGLKNLWQNSKLELKDMDTEESKGLLLHIMGKSKEIKM